MAHDKRVGFYGEIFAGRRVDLDELSQSSSGGLTSWLISELLSRGLVDAVVQVTPGSGGEPLFEYTDASDSAHINRGRKSQYFNTTLADAANVLSHGTERLAVVGVPCYIRALRSAAAQDEGMAQRIKFYIGLVCGHMKTQRFAQSLAWQLGVDPSDLGAVDFRVKNVHASAGNYDFAASPSTGAAQVSSRMRALLGSNWGHGAFQPEACNFCEDVFAETADAVFGDAWLPEYETDWRGTNIVVSRNAELTQILFAGAGAGTIELDPLTLESLCQSQAGNFRHRREGLAVRLADDQRRGLSVPTMRTVPNSREVKLARRVLIRQRRRMSRISIESFERALASGNLRVYTRRFRLERFIYRVIDRVGRLTA
ncbi:MAG: Coenzyme F420 hydrogenase/dehydrogenase, beta subunit C-terminal domain [Demequina sp.]|nr:Coenzyme F420 hydrogenase/dehydrogenase, beta subunit C-terminal domain [Demequina sp.]